MLVRVQGLEVTLAAGELKLPLLASLASPALIAAHNFCDEHSQRCKRSSSSSGSSNSSSSRRLLTEDVSLGRSTDADELQG